VPDKRPFESRTYAPGVTSCVDPVMSDDASETNVDRLAGALNVSPVALYLNTGPEEMLPTAIPMTPRSLLARSRVDSVVVSLNQKSPRGLTASVASTSCIMRPPKPDPENVVENSARPLFAIAIEYGRSLLKPGATGIFRSSTLCARLTTEMLLPPELAT